MTRWLVKRGLDEIPATTVLDRLRLHHGASEASRGVRGVAPRMLVNQLVRSTCQDDTSLDRDNLAKFLMICTQQPCRNASNDKGRDRAWRRRWRKHDELASRRRSPWSGGGREPEHAATAAATLRSAAWHRTASDGIEERGADRRARWPAPRCTALTTRRTSSVPREQRQVGPRASRVCAQEDCQADSLIGNRNHAIFFRSAGITPCQTAQDGWLVAGGWQAMKISAWSLGTSGPGSAGSELMSY